MCDKYHEKIIYGTVTVAGNRDSVWKAWTTRDGIRSFFAPDCNVELEVGGLYEIYFNPEGEPGLRGSDDCHILALQPPQMLSFTWNASPSLPEARQQQTHVLLRFEAIEPEKTLVTLHHDGWGTGGEWDQAYDYFTKAWLDIVLPRLKYRFEHGPIDWDNPPKP